ncbi:MAG TPA: hypothetical protein VJP02_26550 [Candidatus Sulfotelmatobacter sp.]|nr:hypothetical protein [Candidatus Sulfotelmatobacter sp.]
MATDVVQGAQEEFWRPPTLNEEVAVRDPHPAMAEACPRCETEFLLGSKFCHSCGGRRPAAMSSSTRADAAALAGLWERTIYRIQAGIEGVPWGNVKFPSWMRHLHFHEIKSHLGLSTASLIAFVIGLSCVAGALLVGLLTAKTLVDWQAIQYYRAECLLAATASFVAGILLKKPSAD